MVDTYEKHGSAEEGEKRTSPSVFGAYIGFFAGVIWGAVRILEYYFGLTDLVPGFLVEYFFKHQFLTTKWGGVVGWAFFTLFSVAAGMLYALLLRKAKGPWIGLLYGHLWWIVLYLLIGPVTDMMPWVQKLGWKTIVTDLCLFALWGLFIGYSIAVEYTNESKREQDEDGLLGDVL